MAEVDAKVLARSNDLNKLLSVDKDAITKVV